MSLKKINMLWLIIGIIFFIIWLIVKEKETLLPLPEKITSAQIIFQGKSINLEKKQGKWQIDNKNAPKFGEFIKSLKTGCKGEFLAKDFDIKDDIEDVFLILNGNKKLHFSVNNPVFAANILKIEEKIYFCPEIFKAKLMQDKNYWQ